MSEQESSNEPTDGGRGAAQDGAAPATASTPPEPGVPGDWQRALDEQRDRYLRLAAEYDNFRKRAARERQEAGWRAQGDLVSGLVETIDDLMRFAHLEPATADADTVMQGVQMVERKLLKSLAGHGLEVLSPVDEPFNPEQHEAVSTEPAASPDEDHLVSRVFQAGYLFRGQLLRPARVVVRQFNG